ncbi:hypothetical protein LROSRS0_1848 [Furfurilactobacillus rossiae]|nr:hypothetical protein LROSRS0_1848 [Furfurilactobacillus rossiae]
MKHTRYGYISREEAKIDGYFERWLKLKKQSERRPSGRRFSNESRVRAWRKTMKIHSDKRDQRINT